VIWTSSASGANPRFASDAGDHHPWAAPVPGRRWLPSPGLLGAGDSGSIRSSSVTTGAALPSPRILAAPAYKTVTECCPNTGNRPPGSQARRGHVPRSGPGPTAVRSSTWLPVPTARGAPSGRRRSTAR
jgi:hypothetical protein